MTARADAVPPLRVALVAGSLGLGGAEKQLVCMSRALRGMGVVVRVYALTQGEHYEAVLRAAGIEVAWIGRHDTPPLRLAALARCCVAFRPHIVQATHFFANLYSALASRTCGALSVGAIRNDLVHECEANGRWSTWLLRSVDGLIVNSEAALRAAAAFGIARPRVALVTNVIDMPQEVLEECPRTDDTIVVACVGRLVPAKRQDRFLRVLAAARRTRPEIRGLVVGDGPDRAALLALADTLGLFPDGVEFAGRRLDVPALLRGADVFVLTSDHEGLPNALLEAMASGLPVITTPAGDAARVVDHGVTGYVVPGEGEEALAARVVALARSPALRHKLGAAGRAAVAREYGSAELGLRLLEAYARFARHAGRRRTSRVLDAKASAGPLPVAARGAGTPC